ncbi:hypothetical protein D031_4589B, partial [Vibrio parahaemolyticus VP-48]
HERIALAGGFDDLTAPLKTNDFFDWLAVVVFVFFVSQLRALS